MKRPSLPPAIERMRKEGLNGPAPGPQRAAFGSPKVNREADKYKKRGK